MTTRKKNPDLNYSIYTCDKWRLNLEAVDRRLCLKNIYKPKLNYSKFVKNVFLCNES